MFSSSMPHCIAINREITVSTCPLEKGGCYWQHRQTKSCQYTSEDITIEEFCQRVGFKGHPSTEQLGKFRARLREELKDKT